MICSGHVQIFVCYTIYIGVNFKYLTPNLNFFENHKQSTEIAALFPNFPGFIYKINKLWGIIKSKINRMISMMMLCEFIDIKSAYKTNVSSVIFYSSLNSSTTPCRTYAKTPCLRRMLSLHPRSNLPCPTDRFVLFRSARDILS